MAAVNNDENWHDVAAGTGHLASVASMRATAAGDLATAPAEVVARFSSDGYLLLRGLLPRDAVARARATVIQDLRATGASSDHCGGITADAAPPSLLDRQDLATCDAMAEVTDDPVLYELVALLLGHHNMFSSASSEVTADRSSTSINTHPTSPRARGLATAHPSVHTLSHKWLRAVPTGLCTGPHVDRKYLGAGSQSLLTIWIPLGDIPVRSGAFCCVPSSHRSPRFQRLRNEYGCVPAGADGTASGWVHNDPSRIPHLAEYGLSEEDMAWVSADVLMGDVIVFGLDLLHMTANSMTDQWRISVETRWQPSDDPYPPYFSRS